MGRTAVKCSLVTTWCCTHEHVVQQLWLPAEDMYNIKSIKRALGSLSSVWRSLAGPQECPASPRNPSGTLKLTSLELCPIKPFPAGPAHHPAYTGELCAILRGALLSSSGLDPQSKGALQNSKSITIPHGNLWGHQN